LNKIDLLQSEDGPVDLNALQGYYRQHGFEHVVFISAVNKENITAFREMIFEMVKKRHSTTYPNFIPTSSAEE
jgi:50S ribosomal subunit-associated GTPase HflX